jgi:hypothetical protein
LETMNILSKEQKLLIHSLCIEINTSFFWKICCYFSRG